MKGYSKIDIKRTKGLLMTQLGYCQLMNNIQLRKLNHMHYKVSIAKKVLVKVSNTTKSKNTHKQDIIQSI
jgi:hypothetical protein